MSSSSSSASAKLLLYSRPQSPIRSVIFKAPPDAVPTVDELESLQEELRQLKARTLERAKKAGEDLKTIEESMRRIKEREKGKAKQLEKVKRERDYTPDPELIKPRLSSQPLSDELKRKHKKKRKRDDESDHEQDAQRPRKSTPPAPHTHPPKAQKSTPSTSQALPKINGAGDFSIPPPVSLLPTRPPPSERPKAGPSKPTDVTEDFSMAKQPPQTPVTTFYSSVEPYLRPIREEDLGYLEHTNDEVEPYIVPKLGRPYLDVWAEQDALLNGVSLGPGAGQIGDPAPPETFAPPAPKWDPSTLNDPDLVTENRGHGPLTERVLSALLPVGDGSAWKGVKAAEDAMEGRPGGSGAAAARKEKLNVTDLEARIRDTMRYHGLLDTIPEYSDKVDDPISSALRYAQRELRQVVARNKFRKARLLAVANDRISYQEYLDARDSIDRTISTTFTKLQKRNEPKLQKKKKKLGDASASGTPVPDTVPPPPPQCPAALGLGPDEDNRLVVPEQLKQWVDTRRQWVDYVGGICDQKQAERPGYLWGFPETSIYEGMEEEVNAMLLGQQPPQPMQVDKGKGKERAGWDAMDVG
ncbi:histone acetyltransferases subunit 3-domain-containing protein [Mycena amicta]|nr:histone acetyltransferases subunit 3-domain-containing protein [Mycena amicta]